MRNAVPRLRLAAIASCLGMTPACTGAIAPGEPAPGGAPSFDDRPGPRGPDAMSPATPGGQPGKGDDPGMVPAAITACDGSRPRPGPSPIRRLTRFEYDNTVRDLLGDDTRPARAFPPEEIGNGFGNDATALGTSSLLAEQQFAAARGIADRLVADPARLAKVLPCDPARLDQACAEGFVQDLGARAFRRPLLPTERQRLLDVYARTRTAADAKAGVAGVVTAVLLMPQFLYRVELPLETATPTVPAKLDDHQVASRLSYLLWASMPDADLFAAARAGRLRTKDEIRVQAERLLRDPRAREVAAHFHASLFGLVGLNALTKDAKALPRWTPELGPWFRQETGLFLDHVLWEGAGDLGTILTAPFTFVNGPLAMFYGVPAPRGQGFERVSLDPARRAGIMTQGGLLAASTPGTTTNPVLRGAFVLTKLLCSPPPDPPPTLEVREPDPEPTLTTRERFLAHQTEPSCRSCHRLLDPPGFAFEHFDALGVWRDSENGKPIDATGALAGTDVDGSFSGAVDLMSRLSRSQQVRKCYADQWASFAYGRGFAPEDDCTRAELLQAFARAGHDVRALLLALTQTDAFLYREAVTP